MDSPAARAILSALAECWPEHADLVRVVIDDSESRGVVVTVLTSTPGVVIGRGGGVAAAMRERLRAAVAQLTVELKVVEGAQPPDRESPLREEAGLDAGSPGRAFVPDLVGLTVSEAHATARSCGFSITTGDPDDVPITFYLAHGELGHWVVVGQSPLPTAFAPLHSDITVTIEGRGGGGESGDREPRVPRPPRGIIRFEHDLDTQDLEYAMGVE